MHEIRKTELNTNHATFTTFNVSLDNRKTGMISMTKVFPQSLAFMSSINGYSTVYKNARKKMVKSVLNKF